MRTRCNSGRRGQVIVMVTLALFVFMGMLGLLVDLGWSYFVRKSAQVATDAAALAAVKRALELTGGGKTPGAYTCGGTVQCTSGPVDCPAVSGNLTAACQYSQTNGFQTAGNQRVSVDAGDQTRTINEACGQGGATVHHPPTTGCVDVLYWVTVRALQQTPQLFSAILGNTVGTASARATAAVAKTTVPGGLFLLNRGEPWNPTTGGNVPNGANLYLGGSATLKVPPGINLASSATGGTGKNKDNYAGYDSGTGDVYAGFTATRGSVGLSGANAIWTAPPTTGVPDGPQFMDPYSGLGQPPLTTATLTPRPVPGGTITCNPCASGNYFATSVVGGKTVASGGPIVINSNTSFDGGAFGDFNFFGGLQVGGATVTFGPGRYTVAGVSNQSNPALNILNNAMILSNTGGNGSDAGRIIVLTDSQYPGLGTQVQSIVNAGYQLSWPGPVDGNGNRSLYFSSSSIQSGNNANSGVQLYGLNEASSNLPGDTNSVGLTLKDFAAAPIAGQGAGVTVWQDQRNSYVKYTSSGNVDTSCGDINSPCMNSTPSSPSTSPQLAIGSSPYLNINGVVYQPRGAWVLVQASGDYLGPLRIVSGAMRFAGSGTLTLVGPVSSVTTFRAALVE